MRNSNTPADTRIMGVVHDALRRDMIRLETALDGRAVTDRRRAALARHALWMMAFLHRHHEAEDRGLWPLVLERAPHATDVLQQMDADHARIIPAMSAVEQCATHFVSTPTGQPDLARAVKNLAVDLVPHLHAEEREAMPLVSSVLTVADWNRWDKEFNVKHQSLPALAVTGHWLMDGLDPDRYKLLVSVVPPPVRLVIVRGWGRAYRKACALRWGADVPVSPLTAPV